MSGTPNTITPRQYAIARIHGNTAELRELLGAHVANRSADDLYNDQIRVFLIRTVELLQDAATKLQDAADEDP